MLATAADVADTSQKRRTGLLKHKSLPQGEGLWITPCEGIHTWFMKFAIDIVFLDRNRKVLKARSGMGPWRLAFCLRAQSILELPAGTLLATGTARGDQLRFEQA